MTPKEKAKELVKSFMSIEDSKSEFIKGSVLLTSTEAKQCALICVDEMMDEIKEWNFGVIDYTNRINYMKEVKQEIDKM
tara:strand:+ start:230 stop:466 length:237 start_codon:yes stop_codon:yes gene_type:complete